MKTLLLVAIGAVAQGASVPVIMTTFSCSVPGLSVTNSTGCNITDPSTGVVARVNVSASVDGLTAPKLTMSGHVDLAALATSPGDRGSTAIVWCRLGEHCNLRGVLYTRSRSAGLVGIRRNPLKLSF
jgi:hypothetical protein